MPKRSFETVSEFEQHLSEAEEIIFDGTENPIQRPQSYDNQKENYSGKKGTHTKVALLISDKRTKIYYVSNLYSGRHVDMGILKKEFAPGKGWFKKFKVLVDLGFVGIDKLYSIKELVIGQKKPRKTKTAPNRPLSPEQKAQNTQVSRERIFVEHAIGKMKKFRILKNRCRIKCEALINTIVGVCAGLWNYHLELSD